MFFSTGFYPEIKNFLYVSRFFKHIYFFNYWCDLDKKKIMTY